MLHFLPFLIGIGVGIFLYRRFTWGTLAEALDAPVREEMTFPEAVQYFKEPARLKLLKENRQLMAVVTRKHSEKGTILMRAVFDSDKEEVVDVAFHTVQRLDEQFLRHFGDKDMLVLE